MRLFDVSVPDEEKVVGRGRYGGSECATSWGRDRHRSPEEEVQALRSFFIRLNALVTVMAGWTGVYK